MSLSAYLKSRRRKAVRFLVRPPPFNRWLTFYEPAPNGGYIRRVLTDNSAGRGEPQRFCQTTFRKASCR